MAIDFSKYGTIQNNNTVKKTTDFSKYGVPIGGSQQGVTAPDPTAGSTPFLLKPIGELAVLPQIAQKAVASVITAPSRNKISQNQSSIGNIVSSFLSKAHNEPDPIKKQQYLSEAQKSVEDLRKTGANVADLDRQILEANKINVPVPVIGGEIPAISNEPSRGIQQVAGRGINTVATTATGQLGATLGGGALGLGESLEQGSNAKDTAINVGLYALGGKLLDYGFGKIAETGIGKRILTSPVVQTVGKILSPIQTEKATGKYGMAVDDFAQTAAKYADKLTSPSTYLKPVGKGLKVLGQQVGLAKTDEQELQSAYDKVQNYWENAKNKYVATVKYDKNSPMVLAREGIVPNAEKGGLLTSNLMTKEQSDLLGLKIGGEKQTFNKMLDSANIYPSVDNYKRDAVRLINQNFKGVEKQQAISYMEKQFNALERDYAGKIIETASGEKILPGIDANEIKSYLWSNGYAKKMGPTSDAINAETSRLMGNAIKNEIQNAAEKANPELKDAIINLNNRLGELSEARQFLDAMNGKRLSYGMVGRHFARTVGAVIGSHAGVAGGVAGAITADKIVDILQNPKFSVGEAANIIARASQEAPEALQQAQKIIAENLYNQATTLKLPSPTPLGTPENPIITAPPTTYEPQASQINYQNTNPPTRPPEVVGPVTVGETSYATPRKNVLDMSLKNKPAIDTGDKTVDIVSPKKTLLKQKTPPKAEGAIPKTSNLIQEAKKYKSAEEFVKAQNKPFDVNISDIKTLAGNPIDVVNSKSIRIPSLTPREPIRVSVSEDGNVVIHDGAHRVSEALNRGETKIKAIDLTKQSQLTDIWNKAHKMKK